MNDRRNFLLTSIGITSLALVGTCTAQVLKPELTPVTKTLINIIDKWKKTTNSKILFYDNPNVYRRHQFGVYGFFKDGFSFSIEWEINKQENSDFVLRQLVNHYNGKIIGTYKEKIAYQTPGYIMGIKV